MLADEERLVNGDLTDINLGLSRTHALPINSLTLQLAQGTVVMDTT